jgi:hypothetical protein
MSVARTANFGPSCDTSEGRYQVVELSDKKYALVIGEIRLIRRLPLPIHIGSGVTIHEFDSLAELQRAWDGCEVAFESNGDYEAANKLCAAWAAWAEPATARSSPDH